MMRHATYYFLLISIIAVPSTVMGQDIGCNPAVYEQAENRTKALQQQEIEAAKVTITQPTPVEQATCVDQHTELIKAAMIHSNPDGDNTSIATLVQQPLMKSMEQFMEGNIAGSISSMVNDSFNTITSSFLGGLDGGGAPETNCPMNDTIWDMAQCIETPQVTSLSNLISGQLDVLVGNAESAPERLIEQVCRDTKGQLGDYFADVNYAINAVAQDVNQPLSDAASAIQNISTQ